MKNNKKQASTGQLKNKQVDKELINKTNTKENEYVNIYWDEWRDEEEQS